MNAILDAVMSWAGAATWDGLGWFLLKLTLIAGLGHLILHWARRSSAALRHLLAVAALAALVAMPLASAALPAWLLPVLPARQAAAVGPQETRSWTAGAAEKGSRSWTAKSPTTSATAPTTASAVVTGTAPTRSRPWPPIAWPAVVVMALIGVGVVRVGRLALGMAIVSWVSSRARSLEGSASQREFALARERMGVGPEVQLVTSPRASMPAVAGILRPVVILPPAADAWDLERLRVVFLHELAHVRRGDAFAMVIGHVASAILWFHPVVLTLAARARRESELACDDLVLSSGVRPSAYAEHLLHIARGAAPDPLAGLTLALARPSSLESRLVAILSPDVRRGQLGTPALATAALATALVILPFATARVVAAPDGSREKHRASGTSETRSQTLENNVFEKDRAEKMKRANRREKPSQDDEARVEARGSKSGERSFDQAHQLYEAKRYDEAGEAYRQAAEAGYRASTAYYNAACSYALDEQRAQALAALADALEAGFDNVDLLASDSDLDSIRGDRRFQLILKGARHTDGAEVKRRTTVSKYETLRASDSRDPGAWGSVGIDLMRSGAADLAADTFTRQHGLTVNSSSLYNLACAYTLDGRPDEAFRALEQAIDAGYSDAQHMSDDADLEALHDDPRFEQMIRLTRDLELNGGGMNDDDRSSWRPELSRFEGVAREHPKLGRAWFNLGFARLRVGDARGSTEAFTRALELEYRPATTLYDLACAAAQDGDRDAAMRWLERAAAQGMNLSYNAPRDHDLDPLKSDPRFRALIDRLDRQAGAGKHSWKETEGSTGRR